MHQELRNLSIEKLEILLEHLKLSREHLQKQLSPEQFSILENYAVIPKKEERECKIGAAEKFSHLFVGLNSIVTGFFGFGLALTTALEIHLSSILAQIGSLALVCGGIMGVSILIQKKRESKIAISKIKLLNLTRLVNKIIYQKQDEILNKLIKKLKLKYEKICNKKLEKEHLAFDKKEEFISWFYLFHQAIHSKLNEFPKIGIFQYSRKKILKILKKTENSFIEKGELVGDFAHSLKIQTTSNEKNNDLSPFEVLVDPSLSNPKASSNQIPLGKQKLANFLFDLFPTILGVLGSILMWCNLFPTIAHFFNLHSDDLLTCSAGPSIKLFITLFFTLQFGFFYCYSQRKKWQRESVIASKIQKMSADETLVVQKRLKLNLINYLSNKIDKIIKFIDFSNISNVMIKNSKTDVNSISSQITKTIIK